MLGWDICAGWWWTVGHGRAHLPALPLPHTYLALCLCVAPPPHLPQAGLPPHHHTHMPLPPPLPPHCPHHTTHTTPALHACCTPSHPLHCPLLPHPTCPSPDLACACLVAFIYHATAPYTPDLMCGDSIAPLHLHTTPCLPACSSSPPLSPGLTASHHAAIAHARLAPHPSVSQAPLTSSALHCLHTCHTPRPLPACLPVTFLLPSYPTTLYAYHYHYYPLLLLSTTFLRFLFLEIHLFQCVLCVVLACCAMWLLAAWGRLSSSLSLISLSFLFSFMCGFVCLFLCACIFLYLLCVCVHFSLYMCMYFLYCWYCI